jgi:hypothetical protein
MKDDHLIFDCVRDCFLSDWECDFFSIFSREQINSRDFELAFAEFQDNKIPFVLIYAEDEFFLFILHFQYRYDCLSPKECRI